MKKLLILFFAFSATQLIGQVNFPKDTIDFIINEGSDIVNEQHMDIINNQSTGNLNYDYNIILDEYKAMKNWTVLFCDCEECIENYQSTGSCVGLKPKETWFFIVDVTTTKAVENKFFTIAFSNPNDPTDTDTLTLRTVIGNRLSIDQQLNSDLKLEIVPNPAKDKVTLSFPTTAGSNYNLSIVNVLGEEVENKSVQSENNNYKKELNLMNFERGLYFVHLKNGHQSQVKKLVVQ